MRKSSINIQATGVFEFYHNDRTHQTKNSIFSTKNNYYSLSAEEAKQLYKKDIEEKIQRYQRKYKKKINRNTKLLFSAVVNLTEKHTPADVKKICDYLEQKLGTKVYQFCIHRDEGYIDDEGNKHINNHAHVLFSGLDYNGRSVRRKLTKQFLRQLQTDISNILQMPRGTYSEISGRRRLSAKEYKEHKKREEKELKIMKTVTKSELIQEKMKYLKEIKKLEEKLNKYENRQPAIKNKTPFNLQAWLLSQMLHFNYSESKDIKNLDLKGYFINKNELKNEVIVGNKQKNIFITIKNNELIGNKISDEKEQAKIMFQITLANGKDPLTVQIEGTEEFKEEFRMLQQQYLQEQIKQLKQEKENVEREKNEYKDESLKYYRKYKNLENENKELKNNINNLKNELKSLRKKMIEINKQSYRISGTKIYSQQDYLYLAELKRILNAKNYEQVYKQILELQEQVKLYKQQLKQKDRKKQKEMSDINI